MESGKFIPSHGNEDKKILWEPKKVDLLPCFVLTAALRASLLAGLLAAACRRWQRRRDRGGGLGRFSCREGWLLCRDCWPVRDRGVIF